MAVIDFAFKTTRMSNSNLTKIYDSHKTGFLLFVRSYFSGFSMHDAEEIYNDAFLVVYNDIQSGKLNDLMCSLQTYLNQVGKYKILDFYKKRKIQVDYIEDFQRSDIADRIDDIWDNASSERKVEIYKFIEEMDDVRCKQIIFLYYYDGWNMDAIAKGMDLKSPDVAKTTKNRCMQKIKKVFNDLLIKKGI